MCKKTKTKNNNNLTLTAQYLKQVGDEKKKNECDYFKLKKETKGNKAAAVRHGVENGRK